MLCHFSRRTFKILVVGPFHFWLLALSFFITCFLHFWSLAFSFSITNPFHFQSLALSFSIVIKRMTTIVFNHMMATEWTSSHLMVIKLGWDYVRFLKLILASFFCHFFFPLGFVSLVAALQPLCETLKRLKPWIHGGFFGLSPKIWKNLNLDLSRL